MYELTVNYLSTEEIQNDNMGKVILAKVEVNNYKSYGTNWPSDDSGVVADQKVENVAALKSLNASVGDTIETQGYYTVGDGGQAYYTIENKSNQTIDNGKYILLDNAKVAKLVHIHDSHNVKQFGAKGDGVTDDKDAIINAIKASQGMFVYFPEGTYMMSNHAIFSNYSDVNLIGEGENTVIKAMENFVTKKAIFRFENVYILNILRMTFDGNDEVNVLSEGRNNINSYALVDVVGATDASIDSCVFRNTDFDGFRLLNKIDNFSITNSKFVNVNRGVAHNNGYSVDNIYVENNEMEGNAAENSYAVGLNDNIPYNNVFVRNNKILSFNNGIALNKNNTAGYVHNAYVIGNEVKDAATSIIVVYATNATIKNNIIDSMPIKVTTTKGNGLDVESSNMVEISNNIVKNTKFRGIYINEDSNAKVFNNTIIDCGKENINYFFVDIKGPSQNLEFYNNTLTREDTSLHEVLMAVHGDGGVRIFDNTVNNGKIRLFGDASNIYVSNSGTVMDSGTNNTIVP